MVTNLGTVVMLFSFQMAWVYIEGKRLAVARWYYGLF